MTSLNHLTMAEALKKLKSKEITPTELTQAHIKAVEETKPLNAFVTLCFEQAIDHAKDIDQAYQKGEAQGLMAGIPIANKDLFCTQGIRTTASSRILENFIPTYESTVTQNLKNNGAICLGKTSLDEFAMGSSNLTSAFGPVINPWSPGHKNADGSFHFDKKLVPGGSSGGSVTSVASMSVMGATATDTGGSIRQPAAFTGLVGMKPTYGRCSRWGVVAFASSLDQAGPVTRTVQDNAIMLESMCSYDPKDSTSTKLKVPALSQTFNASIKGKKIGIPKEYMMDGMDTQIHQMWQQGQEWLRDAGAEIVPISLPHTKYALPTYYVIAPAEASSNLARYDGVRYGKREEGVDLISMYENTRGRGFGAEVKRRIMIGTYVLSAGYYDAYYIKAQKVRQCIYQDFVKAYEQCDAILTPSAPTVAFGFDDKVNDPISMYLNDVFTVPANLAGLPCISVPADYGMNGLPLGLQVLGRSFDEETVLQVAFALEQRANFKLTPNFMA